MAQPLIKFFRVATLPAKGVPGALYFVSGEGVLYVCTSETSFEAYAGIKAAALNGSILTLTPSVGAAMSVDIATLAQAAVDLSEYAKTEAVNTAISNAIAAEVERANGAYDEKGAAAAALAAAKEYADGLPHENTTYTFAEGTVNGEFVVTPSDGTAQQVKVHGLGDAAYTTVAALESTMDSKDQAIAAAAATDAQDKADKALADAKAWVEEQKYVTASIIDGLATEAYVDAAVKAESDIARAAEKANADAIAAEKARLDAFLNDAGIGDAAVDTLKEIQTYIDEHGEVAATMLQNIADNKAAIENEATTARTAESNLQTAIANEESARKAAIEALDFNDASTGGSKVTVNVTQVDGKITGVTVAESDIASAAALATLDAEVQEHEQVVAGALNDLNDRLVTVEGSVADHETRLATAESDIDALQAAVGGLDLGVKTVKGQGGEYVTVTPAEASKGDVTVSVSVATTKSTNTAYTNDALATDGYVEEQAAAAVATAAADATSKANTAESNAKAYADNLMSWASF